MGLGAPIGLIAGAWVASHWGWRHAFGLVAVPGLVLSCLALFIRDYKSVDMRADKGESAKKKSSLADYVAMLGVLLRTPSLLCVFAGATLKLLRTGAAMNWMPSYLMREGGVSPVQAGSVSSALFLGSILSMVCIGPIIDLTRKYRAHGIPLVIAVCFLLQGGLQLLAFTALPAGGWTPNRRAVRGRGVRRGHGRRFFNHHRGPGAPRRAGHGHQPHGIVPEHSGLCPGAGGGGLFVRQLHPGHGP